ncbi:MAG: hypothetical protein SFV24_19200 [Gemmatimonadales bacterium]|nr:hypothetical protein [Gemmatimonadales bacterium]
MTTETKDAVRIACAVDAKEGTLVWTFPGAGTLSLTLAKCAPCIVGRPVDGQWPEAVINGMRQRIADAYAISRDPRTGKSATPGEKREAAKALVDHYESGAVEWDRKGGGGGGDSLLAKVLIRAYPGKDADALRAYAKARSASEREALLASPTLKPHADAIRGEAGRGIDAEALLAELG